MEHLEQVWLVCDHGILDDRALTEHDSLCQVWVGGQQAPVHKASVADVWIDAVLSGMVQNLLHQLLRPALGVFKEELDRCCEQLQLNLINNRMTCPSSGIHMYSATFVEAS